MNVYHINALAGMRLFLADDSIDAIVTDPPYELGFMGKGWDSTGIAYSVELWREALRVLKPGGHLLAFSGSRTYHRMACAIEDAGFDIRDQIMWVYGSGFPKSLDVSKAIDKVAPRLDMLEKRYDLAGHIRARRVAAGLTAAEVNAWFGYASGVQHWESKKESGHRFPTVADWAVLRARLGVSDEWAPLIERVEAEREVVGKSQWSNSAAHFVPGEDHSERVNLDITAPATDAARQWDGWGTALKPAHEPICVARKPLVGTVAANVLAHGTGALNIDGCRVPVLDTDYARNCSGDRGHAGTRTGDQEGATNLHAGGGSAAAGRWPANLIHDGSDDVLAAFPSAPGQQGALTGDEPSARPGAVDQNCYGTMDRRHAAVPRREEDRSAARFFYCAKASKSDRGPGNDHPTVKPSALMQYLVRLVTPPGGHVLDPFNGSGTTALACQREGFTYTGFDLDAHYVEITRARLAAG